MTRAQLAAEAKTVEKKRLALAKKRHRDRREREKKLARQKREEARAEKKRWYAQEMKERRAGKTTKKVVREVLGHPCCTSSGLVKPQGWIGAYSPESRKVRLERFRQKRNRRVWTRKVKYGVRKNFADSRMRVKGRFVKKQDELLMRDLISLT
jgi:hypothetical protein